MRSKLIYLFLICMLVMACSSKEQQPPFQVNSHSFTAVKNEKTDKGFRFLVTVLPTQSAHFKPDKNTTKREYKEFLQQTSFTESAELKLQLEEQAVLMLEKELTQRDYCSGEYEIHHVRWQDYSVRLSGQCKQ